MMKVSRLDDKGLDSMIKVLNSMMEAGFDFKFFMVEYFLHGRNDLCSTFYYDPK